MKYVFGLLVGLLFISSINLAPTNAMTNRSLACTSMYLPMCASIQVQCIMAPCPPVRQTFGNSCEVERAGGTDMVKGRCEGDTGGPIYDPTWPPIVGGDRDIHGCIGSAGYSWSEFYRKCVRPWEPQRILLRNEIANTNWSIVSLNGKMIQSAGSLFFSPDQVSGKLCNNFSGAYTARGKIVIAPVLMRTLMYCTDTDIMQVEEALDLTRVRANLSNDLLTLTTRRGDILIWKRQ